MLSKYFVIFCLWRKFLSHIDIVSNWFWFQTVTGVQNCSRKPWKLSFSPLCFRWTHTRKRAQIDELKVIKRPFRTTGFSVNSLIITRDLHTLPLNWKYGYLLNKQNGLNLLCEITSSSQQFYLTTNQPFVVIAKSNRIPWKTNKVLWFAFVANYVESSTNRLLFRPFTSQLCDLELCHKIKTNKYKFSCPQIYIILYPFLAIFLWVYGSYLVVS